jgi:hypothetical protein
LADGKYGTLVPVGDVTALAAAMKKALYCRSQPDLLKKRVLDFSEKIA